MLKNAGRTACRLSFSISASRTAVFVRAIVPLAAGCSRAGGPPRAAVRGEVSLDEAPLKAGVIRFIPTGEGKGPVVLTTIKDGRYELARSEGPVLGKNSIEIVATPTDNPVAGATDIRTAWAEYAKASASHAPVAIPRKYNRNSVLSVDVTAKGRNTFDFKLASR